MEINNWKIEDLKTPTWGIWKKFMKHVGATTLEEALSEKNLMHLDYLIWLCLESPGDFEAFSDDLPFEVLPLAVAKLTDSLKNGGSQEVASLTE